MATLQDLRSALRSKTKLEKTPSKQALSDTQYHAGFDIIARGSTNYEQFIVPQLLQLLAPLFSARAQISALEIGPGPRSVFGGLPGHLRRKIRRYDAFEPNQLFAESLENCLSLSGMAKSPLPCLERSPIIHRLPFAPLGNQSNSSGGEMKQCEEKYDVILFCHSMYGMQSKQKAIEQALDMLRKDLRGGLVIVFHRDGLLRLDGLVCHKSASFPIGKIKVTDNNKVLDDFASFITGFVLPNDSECVRNEWRKVCRLLGHREVAHAEHLSFSSPDIMMAFTWHATKLPELKQQLPGIEGSRLIKNREASLHRPAAIYRPTTIPDIQTCVKWAIKHETGLTVLAGGHSGHCVWNNTVSIDMSAFNQAYVLKAENEAGSENFDCDTFIVVETGCTTGDLIRTAMKKNVTVPVGSRPSVGAGLWLQGGIGHLARLYGLTCDAIVGAVVVSVDCGQVFCVGYVPSKHQPAASVRPVNETEMLWALKGAGTEFGIVVSVTFRTFMARNYIVQNWAVPLNGDLEAQLMLSKFDRLIARKLDRDCSADAYLYWDANQLQLGVTIIQTDQVDSPANYPLSKDVSFTLGVEENNVSIVDGVGLFETDMYVSGMHGGHGGGKTSSFKRCLFMKNIGDEMVSGRLVAALKTRPSRLCYLHLLQGGGAVGDMAADATAFGCRDWHFACVVTGVWHRHQDGTETARAAMEWVYSVTRDLLPISSGVYGADLGPDPRDSILASKAFGINLQRLAQLKTRLDPKNVLAYACPLPKVPMGPQLILLVSGESCAGKDHCASVWVSLFADCALKSRVVSISEATKREYAASTGADPTRLLSDRAYKESHRPALTAYFLEQVQREPQLPELQFLKVVEDAAGVDVLLITGIRDKAPVAAFCHLVPNSRLLEVYVQASRPTRHSRKGYHLDNTDCERKTVSEVNGSNWKKLAHRPDLVFENETYGNDAVKHFFRNSLLPLCHEDLLRLADMVHPTIDFPRPNIVFRHVLGISQKPGGLALCTSLLQSQFIGKWTNISAVACCEAGGIVFASALALRINVPLMLVREVGKLPPPIVSVEKSQSHVSSLIGGNLKEKRIEIEQSAVLNTGQVVVVDDTLATGETMCAVLQLLVEAGITADKISVMVVAEFPVHRGRQLLWRSGFGRVSVQSLITFDGA